MSPYRQHIPAPPRKEEPLKTEESRYKLVETPKHWLTKECIAAEWAILLAHEF